MQQRKNVRNYQGYILELEVILYGNKNTIFLNMHVFASENLYLWAHNIYSFHVLFENSVL